MGGLKAAPTNAMNERQTIDLSDEDKRRVVTLDKGTLRRTLGVRHLFSIGYADVGSSIYYALGVTTIWAMGATPFAFLIAGIFFVCTVFTYAELSAASPEAGGSAAFARKAFGDVLSFVAGWALLLSYIMTIAISAYAAMAYLGYFWPALRVDEFHITATLILIGLLLLLNLLGVGASAGLSWGLCLVSVVIQAVLLTVGWFTVVDLGRFWSQIQWGAMPTWPNFIRGISVAMVAYTGVEAMSQMAEEVRNPARSVPRAYLLAMAAVLVFSLGISMIGMSVMSPHTMVRDWLNNPMAGIAAHMPNIT
ncbi:MAG: APC family permease, partial [bacterium]